MVSWTAADHRSRGKFSYNSYHTIQSRNARAEGSFIGEDGQGRPVVARIPAFQLEVPDTE